MDMSNAEKQARFRKKEALKRDAEKIFREAMLSIHVKDRNAMRQAIDTAIDLPTGWTDDDYEHAKRNLYQIHLDIRFDNPHQLANDVQAGRGENIQTFAVSLDPKKYIEDSKVALRNTQALSAHIISAFNLCEYNDSDKAAALMEVMRFVGRSLLNRHEVPKSNATTMCLASIGKQYTRPDWFVEKFADILSENVGEELANNIGQHLTKF